MQKHKNLLASLAALLPGAAGAQVMKVRAISVPTLSWFGLLALGIVLGVAGFLTGRRRK